MSTVTMQELELETAELLPARETLCSSGRAPHAGNTTNIDSGNGNFDGNGNSNFGFLNVLSGDNGNLDGNTVVLFG
jgi:hypothetical protein